MKLAGGGGEVRGIGRTHHVGRAGTVDGDAVPAVDPHATQVCRIEENGVDHQRLGGVVCGDVKADLTPALERIAAGDLPPDAVKILVDVGASQAELTPGELDHEIASGIEPETVGSCEAEPDRPGISPGGKVEVELELALGAVVEEIHPVIDVRVEDPLVGGDPGLPASEIVAQEVVGPARKPVPPQHTGVRVGPHQPHAKH